MLSPIVSGLWRGIVAISSIICLQRGAFLCKILDHLSHVARLGINELRGASFPTASMDYEKLISGLHAERDRLERVIASLEEWRNSLCAGSPVTAPKRRGRKSMPAAERLEVSQRMKKYWASRRKATTR
jgi:hypothetical protein